MSSAMMFRRRLGLNTKESGVRQEKSKDSRRSRPQRVDRQAGVRLLRRQVAQGSGGLLYATTLAWKELKGSMDEVLDIVAAASRDADWLPLLWTAPDGIPPPFVIAPIPKLPVDRRGHLGGSGRGVDPELRRSRELRGHEHVGTWP